MDITRHERFGRQHLFHTVSKYFLIHFLLFPDNLEGLERLWFVGDNLMSETYRTYLKKSRVQFYVKDQYEVSDFKNCKQNSNNRNVLSRILNTFITAVNENPVLPKYIVFVLDDEVLSSLEYENFGVSTMYGMMLEWLVKNVNSTVQDIKQKLPNKAKREHFPQIYWTPALTHKRFFKGNVLQNKFNLRLESIVKLYPTMRVLKFKHTWCFEDDNLMHQNGTLSATGKGAYWAAVDQALKYNFEKKEEFLARVLIAQKRPQNDMVNQRQLTQKKATEDTSQDPVQEFFKRRRSDNYHWFNKKSSKFMLPRLDQRC